VRAAPWGRRRVSRRRWTRRYGFDSDSLGALRSQIERAVPHGFVSIRGRSRAGAWEVAPSSVVTRWSGLAERLEKIQVNVRA
jgi:hypothetical protein